MPELEVSVVEYSLTLESGILQANHHSINQQTLNNLRQNQQCSLSQVGCARGVNIFPTHNQSYTIKSLLTS
jgi:hypothetical protein